MVNSSNNHLLSTINYLLPREGRDRRAVDSEDRVREPGLTGRVDRGIHSRVNYLRVTLESGSKPSPAVLSQSAVTSGSDILDDSLDHSADE